MSFIEDMIAPKVKKSELVTLYEWVKYKMEQQHPTEHPVGSFNRGYAEGELDALSFIEYHLARLIAEGML